MKAGTVSRGLLAILFSAALAGCLSFDESHPLIIAPSPADWSKALSRLDPSDQETLASGTGFITASDASLSGTLYNLRYGPPSKGISFEHLDIAAIADGYNRTFKTNVADRWEITGTMTSMQISSPEGYQRQYFKLDWQFKNLAKRIWEPSGEGQGDGVDIKWGCKESDLVRDANVAFAEAFLRMMVRSKAILSRE